MCKRALSDQSPVMFRPARRRASSSMLPKRSSRAGSPRTSLLSPNALPSVPQLTQQLASQQLSQQPLSHRRSSSLTLNPAPAAMTHAAVSQLLEDLPEDIPGTGVLQIATASMCVDDQLPHGLSGPSDFNSPATRTAECSCHGL